MGKKTNDTYISEVIKKHGDVFDFSNTFYNGRRSKILLKCKKCGNEWETRADSVLNGCGCPECSLKDKSLGLDGFIEKSEIVHGKKYDYSKVEYINNSTKVCIICPKHGEFWQKPNNHMNGQGCMKCKREKQSEDQKLTTEEFKEKSILIHNNKFDYSKTVYVDNNTKVCIICPKHGEFWQRPGDHLKGCGCNICNESVLENEIRCFLINEGIDFVEQKRFDWLGRQSLDFFIPSIDTAIECQGVQHYRPVSFFGGLQTYNHTVLLDKNKFEKCKEHNIKLLYYTKEDVCFENVNVFKTTDNLAKVLKNN